MLELNKLYLMDCMIGMKTFPDKYFDLAIVDPPYGIGNWTMESRKARPYNKKWDVKWNDTTPTSNYFNELRRICKNQIIWGVNYYREHVPSGGAVIWNKGNKSGIGSACEIASNSLITRVDYYFEQFTGFINNEKTTKIHP